MYLTSKESRLLFSIMEDLTGPLGLSEVRERVGATLIDLLGADYFASYVWDDAAKRFSSCVHVNMSEDNLDQYLDYFQFRDPITPTLQKRKRATAVSEVMQHDRLVKTEFYNDFLKRDGLCYGLNFFAYDRGRNVCDLRIWRGAGREDFTPRETALVDAIGPSFVNALLRAKSNDQASELRFSLVKNDLKLTQREVEIADLLLVGDSDQEICDKLGISKPTLRSHVSSIFRKTGVRRRTQLSNLLTSRNSQ